MKVLVIQSAGVHDGSEPGIAANQNMRECFSIQRAFINLGHETDIWGLRHPNFTAIPDFNSYDLIFLAEQYEDHWLPDFSKITKPKKLQWIVDLHVHEYFYSGVTPDMDVCLHATHSYISGYKKLFPNQQHVWFPNALDETFFYNRKLPKNYDFVFIGSDHASRRATIKKLKSDMGLQAAFATGNDMLALISQSRIHFNQNIAEDLNYRNFETIGLGTCLLTGQHPDLAVLGFKHGKNCLIYKEYDHCLELVEESLKSESWRDIGMEGAKLSKTHTYTKRIEHLLRSIGS